MRSRSGRLEGRTTGSLLPCRSTGCPGVFIGVLWETGQQMWLCSQGWSYDVASRTVRVTGGGEISARVINPVEPLAQSAWPSREQLRRRAGWRRNPGVDVTGSAPQG